MKARAATSAEEVEKDKPVANIAADNIIIICGNVRIFTCGNKLNSKSLCVAPTKKLLVFSTRMQNRNCKDKA